MQKRSSKKKVRSYKKRRSKAVRKIEYKKYRSKLRARAAKGHCKRSTNCKEPLAGKTQYCLQHWLDLLKNNNHGKLKENKDLNLMDIWYEQKGKCYFTGLPLVPGETSSLEHLIPLSRGGTNEKENIKFVHITVNCMKRDLTPSEFKHHLAEILPALEKYRKNKDI